MVGNRILPILGHFWANFGVQSGPLPGFIQAERGPKHARFEVAKCHFGAIKGESTSNGRIPGLFHRFGRLHFTFTVSATLLKNVTLQTKNLPFLEPYGPLLEHFGRKWGCAKNRQFRAQKNDVSQKCSQTLGEGNWGIFRPIRARFEGQGLIGTGHKPEWERGVE